MAKANYKKHLSMVDETAVGVGFPVDVVDGMEGVLETFVHSYSVALCLVRLAVRSYCLVHFRLFVDIC